MSLLKLKIGVSFFSAFTLPFFILSFTLEQIVFLVFSTKIGIQQSSSKQKRLNIYKRRSAGKSIIKKQGVCIKQDKILISQEKRFGPVASSKKKYRRNLTILVNICKTNRTDFRNKNQFKLIRKLVTPRSRSPGTCENNGTCVSANTKKISLKHLREISSKKIVWKMRGKKKIGLINYL